jgi:hypothetical protein
MVFLQLLVHTQTHKQTHVDTHIDTYRYAHYIPLSHPRTNKYLRTYLDHEIFLHSLKSYLQKRILATMLTFHNQFM